MSRTRVIFPKIVLAFIRGTQPKQRLKLSAAQDFKPASMGLCAANGVASDIQVKFRLGDTS